MSQEELEELMDQAEDLPASPAKVAILEQAVKLSDSLGDLEQSYAVRQDLIEAAVFGGMDDRALVAFAWCIAQTDQDPERFPEEDLLWRYKWILGSITSFPNVSAQRIHQMEDDYQERLKRSGHGLKAVYKLRMLNASSMGLIDRRDQFEDKWRKAPLDDMADCKACEIDSEVKYLNSKGEYEAAIKAAKPVIHGKVRCLTVPQRTYSEIIFAELSLGRLDKAQEAFKKGYRLVAGNPDYISTICWHLGYLIRAKDFAKGLELIEKHLPWVCQMNNLDQQMWFFSHTGDFFQRLASQEPDARRFRIPESLPIHIPQELYEPATLAQWFQSQASEIAKRFDARNGNEFISSCLVSNRALTLGLKPPESS